MKKNIQFTLKVCVVWVWEVVVRVMALLVVVVVVVVVVFILVVMVGKRGTTTINFNMLGSGCESCCKGVNSDLRLLYLNIFLFDVVVLVW